VVPHRSTNQARTCLTSLSRREAVLSCWYGRIHHYRTFTLPAYFDILKQTTEPTTQTQLPTRNSPQQSFCFTTVAVINQRLLLPMYPSAGAAVLFWFLFMMNTSTNALAASEASNSELPQLQPPDPNKKLPSIKLGETIRFEELGPIILGTDGEFLRSEVVLPNAWNTQQHLTFSCLFVCLFVCLLVP
jgi:hypothetical protein